MLLEELFRATWILDLERLPKHDRAAPIHPAMREKAGRGVAGPTKLNPISGSNTTVFYVRSNETVSKRYPV